MNLEQEVGKFEAFLDEHKQDYECFHLRAVGIKHGDHLICLAGRAILMDCSPSDVPRYKDLFSADDLFLVEEVLPLNALLGMIKQLNAGTLKIGNGLLLLDVEEGKRPGIHANDSTSYWLGHRIHKVGAEIRWWGNDEIQKSFPHEYLTALDHRLGGIGSGYKDLADLVAAFIPGLSLDRTGRPEFQILAPINLDVRGRFHEKSIELAIEVGRRIDKKKLRFVSILRSDFNSSHSTQRTTFALQPSEWMPFEAGFRVQLVIPRRDERVCELLLVYKGKTVTIHFEGLYNQGLDQGNEAPPQEPGVPQAPLGAGQSDELALMSVDFAGSTRLKEKLGSDASRPLLDDWEAHVRGVVPIYGGYVMKWSGDGGLACFWGDLKHENAYAAAQHILFYSLARKTRPIAGVELVKIRIALHSGVLRWEKDPGSIKSHDIDVVCHAEGGLEPPNSIAATETFLKKCPKRISNDFKTYKKSDGERLLRTDLATMSADLTVKQRQPRKS